MAGAKKKKNDDNVRINTQVAMMNSDNEESRDKKRVHKTRRRQPCVPHSTSPPSPHYLVGIGLPCYYTRHILFRCCFCCCCCIFAAFSAKFRRFGRNLMQQPIHQSMVTSLQPAAPFDHYFEYSKNKWNSNQEIADILYAAHNDPQSQCIANQVLVRPNSGTQLIFPRYDGTWFKNDAFIWRRRREGKLVREDHMKLKIHKQQVISANYVHSAICPTFHRRVYWLTHNPGFVLVHYLNESNADKGIRRTAEIVAECIQANNMQQITHQQLGEQLSPIYAHCLKPDEVQVLTNTVLEIFASSQSPTHFQLERRNSCSSAFRRGLSSMALRRQPSANSEIDASHIGSMMKKYGCTSTPAPPDHKCDASTSRDMTSRSPSGVGDDLRSSTLDEISMRSSSSTKSPVTHDAASNKLSPIVAISPPVAKRGDTLVIVGAWYLKGHTYHVTFGAMRVAARLLQAGVLTTTVPAMTSSTVAVRVYCNNQPVSMAKDFGYLPATRDEITVDVPENVLYQVMEKLRIISYALRVYPIWEQHATACDEASLVNLVQRIHKTCQNVPATQIHLALLGGGENAMHTKTILHLVAQLDFATLFSSLVQLAASLSAYCRELDVLARDHDGSTPLHIAARHNASSVAKLIMTLNATAIDVLDDRGRTPGDAIFATRHDDDAVRATELWVLTNGETVTREHLLLNALGRRNKSRVATSSSSDESSYDCGGGGDATKSQAPLHVEISMDTNVHVPDSPKMARLFQTVTSPGQRITDTERAKMADLARQIIQALPARIKAVETAALATMGEVEEDTSRHFSTQHNPMLSSSGNSMDSSCHQFYDMIEQQSVTSRFTSSFDKASFSESETLDFDKDLGEFFTIHLDATIDPIQQRLANLKFNDDEQRDVYEAAMVIQRAYREYRARNTTRRQEDIERSAALKIQGCYRRYKQFCYFKKLHNAAIVVQKHFRMRKKGDDDARDVASGEQQPQEQKESDVDDEDDGVPEHPTLDGRSIRIQVPQTSSSLLREHRAATTIQLAYRGHRKRQAAARKIQNFMRQSRNKLRKMHAQNDDAMYVQSPPNPSPQLTTTTTMSLEHRMHGCTTNPTLHNNNKDGVSD